MRADEIESGCWKPFGSVSPPLRWLRSSTCVRSCSNTGSVTDRVMQPRRKQACDQAEQERAFHGAPSSAPTRRWVAKLAV